MCLNNKYNIEHYMEGVIKIITKNKTSGKRKTNVL